MTNTNQSHDKKTKKVTFKIALFMWKCVHGAYLQEHCVPVEDVRGRPRLRSASTRCIQLLRVRTSTGQQSSAFHGPSTLWDSSFMSLRAFKEQLKFGRGQ